MKHRNPHLTASYGQRYSQAVRIRGNIVSHPARLDKLTANYNKLIESTIEQYHTVHDTGSGLTELLHDFTELEDLTRG